MKVEVANYLRNWSSLFSGKSLFMLQMLIMQEPFGIRSCWLTPWRPPHPIMMEVTMLFTVTLFKCYIQSGSITLMMPVSALQRMLTTTPSFSVFSNFPPFNIKAHIIWRKWLMTRWWLMWLSSMKLNRGKRPKKKLVLLLRKKMLPLSKLKHLLNLWMTPLYLGSSLFLRTLVWWTKLLRSPI